LALTSVPINKENKMKTAYEYEFDNKGGSKKDPIKVLETLLQLTEHMWEDKRSDYTRGYIAALQAAIKILKALA